MPRREYRKEFIVPVSSDSHIRYRFDPEAGGIAAFVVQYEVQIANTLYQVVRFDCAHGYAHRDLLDSRGRVIEKQPFPAGISQKEALDRASHDLRIHWQQYRDDFIQRLADERTDQAADRRARLPRRKRRGDKRRR